MTNDSPSAGLSYPRHRARTRGFTLGVPRAFSISPDGERIVFIRSKGGADPVTCLWIFEVANGTERCVADPRTLLPAPEDEDVPPEERARRERAREQAGGIVAYATDRDVEHAVFALSGRAFVAGLRSGEVRELPAVTPLVDPRLDPTGTRVAYVSGGALRISGPDGDRPIAEPDADDVTWGLAEFIAAEEMGRQRGFWWSPDGNRLLAARVDNSPVRRWYIADPADPERGPLELAYPAAGTPNAAVGLSLFGLDGSRTPVEWDNTSFPYLATVTWDEHALLLVVQSRNQRVMRILEVDPTTGATTLRREDTDPRWVDIVSGVPAFTGGGELIWVAVADGAYRLLRDGKPVTPPDLQVRSVLDVDGDVVLFSGSTDPTEIHLFTHGPDGLDRITDRSGVHHGRRSGGTTVLTSYTMDRPGPHGTVSRGGTLRRIASHADTPRIEPNVNLIRTGDRALATAVVLPSDHGPGSGPLPVLMDPYGGPHAQRVVARRGAYLDSQWFADHGFAVVIIDGRGTPGRGPDWERAVRGDLAEPVLTDQVDALQAVAERVSDLDLSRVAIRGWSFGGYLSALAVLRRPDVFHAAIAGAPVTEWRLYDTHYTERYLGHPDEEPETYGSCSLLADADKLNRPLMLIHGLADDNVVAAHTLRLSSALLAAGRPHTVLPLSGVTHMASQEVVVENLLRLQIDFLQRAFTA